MERREVASSERVVASRASRTTVVEESLEAKDHSSLAAKDHSRERAHLDTREREMGPLRGVGPVAGRASHINARRAMAKKESQAGYDLCVGYKQWSQRSR